MHAILLHFLFLVVLKNSVLVQYVCFCSCYLSVYLGGLGSLCRLWEVDGDHACWIYHCRSARSESYYVIIKVHIKVTVMEHKSDHIVL